jgi:hypothetical protein
MQASIGLTVSRMLLSLAANISAAAHLFGYWHFGDIADLVSRRAEAKGDH